MAGVVLFTGAASELHDQRAPIFVTEIPAGYRDWKLSGRDVSVPRGRYYCADRMELHSFGGKQQNLWPRPVVYCGPPTNGVQFMVKDSKKYAATGGWGFAHFNDGKPAAAEFMQSCYKCHPLIESHDLVFTKILSVNESGHLLQRLFVFREGSIDFAASRPQTRCRRSMDSESLAAQLSINPQWRTEFSTMLPTRISL